MANLVEMKIYVTEATRKAIQAEMDLCGCSATAFIRTAILKEIVARTLERKKGKGSPELPGQLVIASND